MNRFRMGRASSGRRRITMFGTLRLRILIIILLMGIMRSNVGIDVPLSDAFDFLLLLHLGLWTLDLA